MLAIPTNLTKEDIIEAIKYIKQHDVPEKHQSTTYHLVSKAGDKYPPKYVVSVANHLVNDVAISTEDFNTIQAKRLLENLGFTVETKQEKFELTIMAHSVTSTDENFTSDDLTLGDYYEPLDSYFHMGTGEVIRRKYNKYERKVSNQVLPRLTCQVFEEEITALSAEEKKNFPICQYSPDSELIRGIYSSEEEFKAYRNSIEFVIYPTADEEQFVFYCWNIFSTIVFIQECLKKFGNENDKFVLHYRSKNKNEKIQPDDSEMINEAQVIASYEYKHDYSSQLIDSKNIIFRGAPGTGKSFLAKQIAADIISNGETFDYTQLTDEQKRQVEFIQFHPSYDYSDFVEGLRPKINADGTMGFELQDGIFKKFVARAKKNLENAQKSQEELEKESVAEQQLNEYFANIELELDQLTTARGTKFYITDVDDRHVKLSIPNNEVSNKLSLEKNDLHKMLESDKEFHQVKDVTEFFGKVNATQQFSYILTLYKDIIAKTSVAKPVKYQEKLKPFVFIIDEINRGEISKIFGELFFSIDPGYRGPSGEVSTQYANLHDNPEEKFYIPENVYIIGTMNDIDRSVDSFDFAMRRRFRFIEIMAAEQTAMLDRLGARKDEAIARMTALNDAISKVAELNENYHIGPSYFLKLLTLDFDQLWADYLQPLLQDYIRGMYDEENIMQDFFAAYQTVEVEAKSNDVES